MALRMTKAIYRKENVTQEINLDEMTEELYKEVYGHLYCTNPICTAKVLYAYGEKVVPYYKTWKAKVVDGDIKNEHIENCPYSVERELLEREARRKDPNLLYSITDEHLRRVLQKAYDREFNPDKFKKKPKESGQEEKKPSSRSKVNKDLLPTGKAGLLSDGANATERQPSIYRTNVDDLNAESYGTVRCVIGYVSDMVMDGRHPFIKLITKDNRTARILISEAFKVNYPTIYDNLGALKWYIDEQKEKGHKVFCSCVGKITKDDYEISVILENYIGITLNNESYYSIIRLMNKLA